MTNFLQNMYFKTDEITVDTTNDSDINQAYDQGFVFTRVAKGNMIQTRSLRIDLNKFELSSENKRILNKTEALEYELKTLPLEDYSWEIHKLGKEFYSTKFGDNTMSAAKIKEMFTDEKVSNMSNAFIYNLNNSVSESETLSTNPIGYCLAYINSEILHYAYPFYDLNLDLPNLGMGMMLRAILWAKENNKKYVYLGSIVEPSSKYKLQFEGLEWWNNDKKEWSTNLEEVKNLLQTT